MKFVYLAIMSLLAVLTTASTLPQNLTDRESLVDADIPGESHFNVRFSAVTTYPFSHITGQYGACSAHGTDPAFLINDPNTVAVALDANVANWASYCGKKIRLWNPDGRTVEAIIMDKCPGCAADGGAYSLDLFEAPWNKVGGRTSADNVRGASWEVIG